MPSLRSISKPTPFKVGCLVVLLSTLLFYSFGLEKPALLAALDNRVTDAMFRWRGARPTSGQVAIVDIDETSLAKIGQWPWPRHRVAELIGQIGSASPKAIGFDVVFAEADRTSPKNFVDELRHYLPDTVPTEQLEALREQTALDHDLILGAAVAATPTVLGYVFQTRNDGLKSNSTPFPTALIRLDPPGARLETLTLHQAYRAILNVETIAQGQSEGFFNVVPDVDGTVRKVPLFMGLGGLPYPSLALEMVRLGSGEQAVFLHAATSGQATQGSLLGVSLANHFYPTDELGQLAVNFRGPAGSFPSLSAADILTGQGLDQLGGKYVLIGTSAAGLLDLRATPFASVFPGVEVHANVIDNLLARDPLVHDVYTEIGFTYLLVIVGGLFLSALLAFASPLAGGLGGVLLIEATVLGNYYLFFCQNKLIGVVYPLATVIVVFMFVTLFNYFYEGRERRFISKAFSHYVSPQIVEQLSAHPEKLSLTGEQKVLTVLFSDIRGFTTISEKMDSVQLGQFMNEYLTAMSDIVMANKGTVDKFIGDAVMAIWGAPLDDEAHAANCLRAAFAMMSTLATLRPQWQGRGLPDIDIGIGINTGPMSVGNFGSLQRFDYTVMGDNVNLASRLEGLNKTYGSHIIISEFTRQAVGNGFFCRILDLVRVKGKALPVTIFEPLCEGEPDPETMQAIDTFHLALDHYRNQRFDQAEHLLTTLQERRPAKIHELYLSRIAHFRHSPPPADWDGAFTFTTK